MHLGFAAELLHALAKRTPVGADRLTQGVVAVENRAKFEGKYGALPEACADPAGMFNQGFVVKGSVTAVILADDNGKLTAGIAKYGNITYALNTVEKEGLAGTNSIGKCLQFRKTIGVPHKGLYLRARGMPSSSQITSLLRST